MPRSLKPCFVVLIFFLFSALLHAERPNVILIMTDDQGYGDIAVHGNEKIKTPHLDRLHTESVRFTNFHVDPTCSPTRAALMTGRFSRRSGVWHTIMGRSLISPEVPTVADLFKKTGYRTGMFGKWHLGDNYPSRPNDCGFDDTVYCGGGGIWQTPDWWENDYFDDTYMKNGKPVAYKGYCTDVFFDEALRFIKKNRERPFFCYLPTNAAHGPFWVAEKYSQPYRDADLEDGVARFYGMITNIDENVGRLVAKLREWQLEDNTILIFLTDNGSTVGGRGRRPKDRPNAWLGFDGGMRGRKGSEYHGGHRVPFFIRWPKKFGGARDVKKLAAHIDVLPTLAELCGINISKDLKLDGRSLVPLLTSAEPAWKDRTIVIDSQRIDHPEKWRKSSVMDERWHLINGTELYDILRDPKQASDVSSSHPEVVKRLRTHYEAWWKDISRHHKGYVSIGIGSDRENPSRITGHDWHAETVPWNQNHIRNETFYDSGFWSIEVERAGSYEFTLRRFPREEDRAIEADRARLKIAGFDKTQAIDKDAREVTFNLELKPGKTRLQTWFEVEGESSRTRGAYFVYVQYLN